LYHRIKYLEYYITITLQRKIFFFIPANFFDFFLIFFFKRVHLKLSQMSRFARHDGSSDERGRLAATKPPLNAFPYPFASPSFRAKREIYLQSEARNLLTQTIICFALAPSFVGINLHKVFFIFDDLSYYFHFFSTINKNNPYFCIGFLKKSGSFCIGFLKKMDVFCIGFLKCFFNKHINR